MSLPTWKTLWCTDDERCLVDATGVYEPELEVAQEVGEERFCTDDNCPVHEDGAAEHSPACEARPAKFEVFRIPLERLKIVEDPDAAPGVVPAGYVVPVAYNPSWPQHPIRYREWFMDSLGRVAESIGQSERTLITWLCSVDTIDRAAAYRAIGGYHGFRNFDTEPMLLTEAELDRRWER